MKSLSDLDAEISALDAKSEKRIPIDPTHTSGDNNNLFIISASGSYYLPGNYSTSAAQNGINVQADNVTIDLNGFGLFSTSTNTVDGIYVGAGHQSITIRNGSIRGWGGHGINELDVDGKTSANGTILEKLMVFDNNSGGILAGDNTMVRDCIARHNHGDGVAVGAASAVEGCSSVLNTGGGFGSIHSDSSGTTLSAPTAFTDCAARANTNGFVVQTCLLTNCSANINTNAGYLLTDDVIVRNSSATANKSNGFSLFGKACLISGCLANGNAGAGFYIYFGHGSRLEHNLAAGNASYGIQVDTSVTGNVVVGNTAAGNKVSNGKASNYFIFAANYYGAIIDDTSADTASVPGATGNQHSSTLGTTDPWANISLY